MDTAARSSMSQPYQPQLLDKAPGKYEGKTCLWSNPLCLSSHGADEQASLESWISRRHFDEQASLSRTRLGFAKLQVVLVHGVLRVSSDDTAYCELSRHDIA